MRLQGELGPAQIAILKRLANGLSRRQLAAELGFSEHAVSALLRSARATLGARSEMQAVILHDRQTRDGQARTHSGQS